MAVAACAWAAAPTEPLGPAPPLVERGRYLVLISHCNNCRTDGYSEREGAVPEDRWLTGNPVGWRSPRGQPDMSFGS